jgi:hypothetical protein
MYVNTSDYFWEPEVLENFFVGQDTINHFPKEII